MQQTINKYFCDYCKNEVSMTEHIEGTKIDIKVSLVNPKGGCGQVSGVSMVLCKKCSEELGIINSEEYHSYIYSQSRLRDTIKNIKTKIVDMLFKK